MVDLKMKNEILGKKKMVNLLKVAELHFYEKKKVYEPNH